MTEKEKKAKIKIAEDELNGVKKHRKPSDGKDNLAVESISIEQGYKDKNAELKVLNSNDTVTVLSDVSVKTIPGGFEEVNAKQSKNVEEPEI